jgi:4-hydroxy-4-methyl-2-oxoglutarate aldolase
MTDNKNVSLAAIEQLREFDGALIANTLVSISTTPAHEIYMESGIQSVTPALGPAVGIALTCEVDSSTPGNQADLEVFWDQLAQMEAMQVPTIWVVKTAGSRPGFECVIGDGMAKLLKSAGCQGLVTDGAVRDVPGLLTTAFAAYCRGVCIHHTALRFFNPGITVEVGGLQISSGDLIHASGEGVIKIPHKAIDATIEKCPAMRAFEHEVHTQWRRSDITISEKRQVATRLLDKYQLGLCVS